MTVAVGARTSAEVLALTFLDSAVNQSPPAGGSDDPFEVRAIAAVRRGETNAYDYLVAKYGRRVLAIAGGLVRDPAEAEDLAQEAFVRAYQSIGRFREGEPFGPWIYRIVSNLALDSLKSKKRRPPDEDLSALLKSGDDPGRELSRRELAARIDRAMESLPPMQRLVARLYLVEQFDYAEIAQMTRLGESTVRSHLSLARARLQDALRDASFS